MLWVKVLENDVQCSASDAEKVACEGVVVGDDGSAFMPLFFLFQVDKAVRDGEFLAESPFVAGAEATTAGAVVGGWVVGIPCESSRLWGGSCVVSGGGGGG